MHAASYLSQRTMLSDENLFQMHSVVWLAGYTRLAGYARLAVLLCLSAVCGARHYAQLGKRAKRPRKSGLVFYFGEKSFQKHCEDYLNYG